MAVDESGARPGLEALWRRPGMYIGPTDARGVLELVRVVLAEAYDEYVAGRCSTISVEVAADDTVTIVDDGPGMVIDASRDGRGLDAAFAHSMHLPWDSGDRWHVHFGLGKLGLAVVNGLCERLEIIAVRNGIESRALYARGDLSAPLESAPTSRANGTTVRFLPDGKIFSVRRLWRTALAQWLEDLSFLSPKLILRWSIAGDAHTASGLVGRVASAAACQLDDVARYRGSYARAEGTLEVELALAWHTNAWWADPAAVDPAAVDSFVNLARTPGGGTHVEGVLDGIRQFLDIRDYDCRGLVASISVVLHDVVYSSYVRRVLETPIRAFIAEATCAALEHWAATHADAVAALRTLASNATPKKAKPSKSKAAPSTPSKAATSKAMKAAKSKPSTKRASRTSK